MNNDTLLRRTGYLTFLLSGVCAISSGIIVSFLQDLHGLSFGVTGSLLSMMNIGNMAASSCPRSSVRSPTAQGFTPACCAILSPVPGSCS